MTTRRHCEVALHSGPPGRHPVTSWPTVCWGPGSADSAAADVKAPELSVRPARASVPPTTGTRPSCRLSHTSQPRPGARVPVPGRTRRPQDHRAGGRGESRHARAVPPRDGHGPGKRGAPRPTHLRSSLPGWTAPPPRGPHRGGTWRGGARPGPRPQRVRRPAPAYKTPRPRRALCPAPCVPRAPACPTPRPCVPGASPRRTLRDAPPTGLAP